MSPWNLITFYLDKFGWALCATHSLPQMSLTKHHHIYYDHRRYSTAFKNFKNEKSTVTHHENSNLDIFAMENVHRKNGPFRVDLLCGIKVSYASTYRLKVTRWRETRWIQVGSKFLANWKKKITFNPRMYVIFQKKNQSVHFSHGKLPSARKISARLKQWWVIQKFSNRSNGAFECNLTQECFSLWGPNSFVNTRTQLSSVGCLSSVFI